MEFPANPIIFLHPTLDRQIQPPRGFLVCLPLFLPGCKLHFSDEQFATGG